MTDTIEATLGDLRQERLEIESTLRSRSGELTEGSAAELDRRYGKLQAAFANLAGKASSESVRIEIMLELIRIMENRLVYLENFAYEPTSDNRGLATLAGRFLEYLEESRSTVLTPLERTYFRGITALHAGEGERARAELEAACASEESDEANDIKYKSYVILGNLLHQERRYEAARDAHDRSLKYSGNENVAAQALAFKALNCYALQSYDEALSLFEEALSRFRPDEPFFNSYFHRNALLFCGSIHVVRKEYAKATSCYRRVLDHVEPSSYDYFDALSQIGRISYAEGRYDEAIEALSRAVESHRFSENEHLVDTYFWLARSYVKKNQPQEAKELLEKITASEVQYPKKPQAAELLKQVS
ncbi:MAG TPA: tetratricopeptide repeat protein [Thermoanaerobaculia bacterium]|nr:tetratricopeptide repeat protein [Thermoanaerobaculia bacterium]